MTAAGDAADAEWWARMEYLFRELPFPIRHRWGGDVKEFVEGIDASIKRLADGAAHPNPTA